MAELKEISEKIGPYVDISKEFEYQIILHEKLLKANKSMNIMLEVEKDLRKEIVSQEQQLDYINTSISGKMKEILSLENLIRQEKVLKTGQMADLIELYDKLLNRYEGEIKSRDTILAQLDKQIAATKLLENTGLKKMVDRVKEYQDLWKKDKEAAVLSASFKIFEKIWEAFKSIDAAAASFRMNMGMTRDYTSGLYKMATQLTMELTHVGVNADIANEAIFELSKNLFSSVAVTKDVAENVSLMRAQLGVAESTSAEFLKSLGMMTRSTAQSQVNMSYFGAALSNAAGVPLGQAMEDVNLATKNSYQFVAKTGISLVKAAIEARRMGTSLESATQTVRALLNFTQNVRDEMEASVLVGKSINLQKARELAYHRDIRGLNAEILNIMKETNFENLDPFQQEAVAKALGKSAGELGEMAQAERQRLNIERSTNPEIQKQLKAYKELMSANEERAKLAANDLLFQLRNKANQAAIVALTQSWTAVLQRAGEIFIPIISLALRGIAFLLGLMNNAVLKWVGGILLLGYAIRSVWKVFQAIKLTMTAIGGVGGGKAGGAIASMMKGVGEGLKAIPWSAIGKLAVGIALIVGLGLALMVLSKGFSTFAGVSWSDVFIGLGLAAFAIAAAILGAGPVPALVGVGELVIAGMGIALGIFALGAMLGAKAMEMLGLAIPVMVDGLKSLSKIGIFEMVKITAKLYALTATMASLALLAVPMMLFGTPLRVVAIGMSPFLESLKNLETLSFNNTIAQINGLVTAIAGLSKVITTIPDIKLDKLQTPSLGGGAGAGVAGKDPIADLLDGIKTGIENLRKDLSTGAITAVIRIDNNTLQAMNTISGRKLGFVTT